MTMDTENGPTAKTQPKRSFDVAFLTGANETQEDQHQTSVDEDDDDEDDELRGSSAKKSPADAAESGSPRSAFKKVSKSADTPTSSSGLSGPVDLSVMTPPYYHPFAFPAIATTLSLQLLQQNTKGLAMSALFGNPAVAAAAMAQQQGLFPQPKSAPRPSGRPDGANNLIEDYIRASLYHQQQLHDTGKDFGPFGAGKAAMRQDSAPFAPFNPALDHRLARPNSSSMAPSIATSPATPSPAQPPQMQLPAAALAASLASAPSQNVCAKCNLSFRMTSDLVYHMRSQHRRDASADPVRQKRQEKLRCPVCGENFRERHHLTRHMTSHEDRDAELK